MGATWQRCRVHFMPPSADPSPAAKPSEKVKASGGKSKASRASKLDNPLTITASTVTSIPDQSTTISFPTAPMRR